MGAVPEKPRLPKTTNTMGAMANTGTVCDATIHGSSARSSVRLCTIKTDRSKPSAVPITKPVKVDCPVTATWNSRLRGESMGHSVRLP